MRASAYLLLESMCQWMDMRWSQIVEVSRVILGFLGGSVVICLQCRIPGSGRSPEGGHGNLLQYSCLENSMDRGAWWVTVHVIAQSDTEVIKQRRQQSYFGLKIQRLHVQQKRFDLQRKIVPDSNSRCLSESLLLLHGGGMGLP